MRSVRRRDPLRNRGQGRREVEVFSGARLLSRRSMLDTVCCVTLGALRVAVMIDTTTRTVATAAV